MMNEKFSDSAKKMISDMEIFLKEAFCIDGECNYIEQVSIDSSLKKINNSMLFALGDSKRGQFYVTISQ